MEKQNEEMIKKLYAAFNAREIDTALSTMHPAIQWPKAFEGGSIKGRNQIREYWTKQWLNEFPPAHSLIR